MPTERLQFSLGASPQRFVERGPQAGTFRPQFRVKLPGWSDVVDFFPESTLSPEEQRRLKRERLGFLRDSPTPEVVRDFAEIGKTVDDVQDALVTLSVMGRVATKLSGRVIPGLGWVATAADVLNAWNIFYPDKFTAAAARAPRAFVRGGEQAGVRSMSRAAKRDFHLTSTTAGGTYKRRLEETIRTGKIGFGVGEAFQILQTTDLLFDVGLKIGPIFGAMGDTAFGVMRGAEFDITGPLAAGLGIPDVDSHPAFQVLREQGRQLSTVTPPGASLETMMARAGYTAAEIAEAKDRRFRVTVDFPGIFPWVDWYVGAPEGTTERKMAAAVAPVGELLSPLIVDTLKTFSWVKRFLVDQAVKNQADMMKLYDLRDDLSFEDHLAVTVAHTLALNELVPVFGGFDYGLLAAEAARQPWSGPLPRGVRLKGPVSRGDVVRSLLELPSKPHGLWIEQAPDVERYELAKAVVNENVDQLLAMVEGPGARVQEDAGPLWRAPVVAHDLNLLPPDPASRDELARYFGGIARMIEDSGGETPSREAVEPLFRGVFEG